MKSSPSEWKRLLAAARQAPGELEATAPYGFATRVAAQAFSVERPSPAALFARLSWRALGVAALIMAVTIATNLQPVMNSLSDEVATLSEPVVAVDAGDSPV